MRTGGERGRRKQAVKEKEGNRCERKETGGGRLC